MCEIYIIPFTYLFCILQLGISNQATKYKPERHKIRSFIVPKWSLFQDNFHHLPGFFINLILESCLWCNTLDRQITNDLFGSQLNLVPTVGVSKKKDEPGWWFGCWTKNMGKHPKSSHFNRIFHYKPSILGYPYFWKHPFGPHIELRPFFLACMFRLKSRDGQLFCSFNWLLIKTTRGFENTKRQPNKLQSIVTSFHPGSLPTELIL